MRYLRYYWTKYRRGLQARLRYALNRQPDMADIRQTLALLAPYRTEHPLIRLGKSSQSGYLLPDDLDGIAASFSPGVGPEMDFDLEILARDIPTHFVDASVPGLPRQHPLARFEPLFIGAQTRGNVISLDDWFARHAPESGDLILQMDIEGAEYASLDAASDAWLGRCRIILLELHEMQRIFKPGEHAQYRRVFEKLTRNHAVVHIHANNSTAPVQALGLELPPVIEVTFLRRDRFRKAVPETRFPHPLDSVTTPSLPDYGLPKFWLPPGH